MTNELIDYINKEVEDRGWSYRELSRRAELGASTVSAVMAERSNPGLDFCIGISRALGEPRERIFRLAGILPPMIVGNGDLRREKYLIDYFRHLPEEQKNTVLTIVHALHEKHAQYTTIEDDDEF